MTQEDFGAEVVASAFEYGARLGKFTRIRPIDTPPGQDAGQGDHVFLGITAIGAERVQLHHLAREILIEPCAIAARTRAPGGRAQGVVEINEHRRVPRYGEKQVAKPAQREGTDRSLLVVADP